MTIKNVLVIHEISEKLFELPLENYILTFDDALYSQYYYWPIINKINTKKILFISPSLVYKSDIQRDQFSGTHLQFPNCYEALKLHKENNSSNYMTLKEIKSLDGVSLGAHSFHHFKTLNSKLFEKTSYIKKDTELLLNWFKNNLLKKPVFYAFPHYIEHDFQRIILKSYGFTKFFGKNDRLQVEKLL